MAELSPPPAADGYKLRLICGGWYLLRYMGRSYTGWAHGPYNHADAVAAISSSGLINLERELGERGK